MSILMYFLYTAKYSNVWTVIKMQTCCWPAGTATFSYRCMIGIGDIN